MNTNKETLRNLGLGLIGAAALASLAFFSGCITSQRVTTDPTTGVSKTNLVYDLDPLAGKAVADGATFAALAAVQKDPNAGPYLQLVAQAFQNAANSGNYDPAQLQAALKNISIKEVRTPVGQSVATMVFSAYKSLFAENVNGQIDQTKWGPFVKDVLVDIANGITSALPVTSSQ